MSSRTYRGFPWARPRHELLLLVLVAVGALTPINVVTEQDRSRLCLTQALTHGRISNDPCFAATRDRAAFAGHFYSDKAPGVSVLALPAEVLLRPGPPQTWSNVDDLRVWGVRLLSVGLAYCALVLLVGRVAEGLRSGTGGAALVTFGLGTLVAPLAATGFGHVPAALLVFATFLLAWSRRPFLSGLVGGAALLVDYESGLALAVFFLYLAATGGWRSLRSFLAGIAPGILLLGLYDWAAFGSPWHLSYRYVAPEFAADQASGFFGIGVPHWLGIYKVFSWHSGLLVLSPVLTIAVLGLVLLYRTRPAEAVAAAAVAALYVLADCGYFDPFGGRSPGPRFLTAGLPFLAVGLAPAFARLPRLTLLLASVSVFATTALTVAWSRLSIIWGGLWGELDHVPGELGSSRFVRALAPSIYSHLGLSHAWGAAVVAACAVTALSVAATSLPWRRASRPSPGIAIAVTACLAMAVAGNVLAVADYPYGEKLLGLPDLRTRIISPAPKIYLGGMINLQIDATDVGSVGATRTHLIVRLPPELRLVGPPIYTRGSGCTGTETLDCTLDNLSPNGKDVATIFFGLQATTLGPHTINAAATAPAAIGNTATLTLTVTP